MANFVTDFEIENPLACYLCGRIYKLQCVLNRHLREVHKVKVLPGGNLKCPLCVSFRVNRQTSLRLHLEDTHGIKCERRNIKFPNYEVFQKWKSSEEKETMYSYTKNTSTKAVAGKAERFYFHCHRSGYYQTKSTGERRLKRQGSNRIESTCPSMMVVTKEETGQTRVNYWKTHVGHQADLLHSAVPKRTTVRIIGKNVSSRRSDTKEDEDEPELGETQGDLVIVRRVEGGEEEDEGGEDVLIRARRRLPSDIRLTVFRIAEESPLPACEAFRSAVATLLERATGAGDMAMREATRLVKEATAIVGHREGATVAMDHDV